MKSIIARKFSKYSGDGGRVVAASADKSSR